MGQPQRRPEGRLIHLNVSGRLEKYAAMVYYYNQHCGKGEDKECMLMGPWDFRWVELTARIRQELYLGFIDELALCKLRIVA